jgi:hypothetical protein
VGRVKWGAHVVERRKCGDSVGGASATFDRRVAALKDDVGALADFETRARNPCDRLAVLEGAPLIRSRMETLTAHNYGALRGVDCKAVLTRAAARLPTYRT